MATIALTVMCVGEAFFLLYMSMMSVRIAACSMLHDVAS